MVQFGKRFRDGARTQERWLRDYLGATSGLKLLAEVSRRGARR